MSKALQIVDDAEIISVEELKTSFGLVPANTVQQIATNMVEHYRGKVAGGYIKATDAQIAQAEKNGTIANYRKSYDIDGNEIIMRPGTKKELGDLLLPDAIRVTQKTLSRGLNPLAHISLWYQAGQLVDSVNYQIQKGMAEQQGKTSPEFFNMDASERKMHGLKPADIGKVCYLVPDENKTLYLQATMQFASELGFSRGKEEALKIVSKSRGIGIVRKDEGLYVLKGRSLEWTAEKRAMTDAIRRAFGEMTPAQIAHYASGQGFLQEKTVETLASPDYSVMSQLPAEDQRAYIEYAEVTQEIQDTDPETLQAKARENVDLMRGTEEDEEPENPPMSSMEASTNFWKYANAHNIDRDRSGQYIRDYGEDFIRALKALKAAVEAGMLETDKDAPDAPEDEVPF